MPQFFASLINPNISYWKLLEWCFNGTFFMFFRFSRKCLSTFAKKLSDCHLVVSFFSFIYFLQCPEWRSVEVLCTSHGVARVEVRIQQCEWDATFWFYVGDVFWKSIVEDLILDFGVTRDCLLLFWNCIAMNDYYPPSTLKISCIVFNFFCYFMN